MLYFAEDPDVPLLRSLVRGSLKQNLLRALRLWVWLRLLYADSEELTGCPLGSFTFAEWRSTFFSKSHPTDESIPSLHDPNCPCAKTVHDWILQLTPEFDRSVWEESLRRHDSLPDRLDSAFNKRLFGVTRRSLDEDLRILVKQGWLQRQKRRYGRVDVFPEYRQTSQTSGTQPLLHPDLIAIANTLAHPMNGYQRFFLHVEYVVPKEATDRVDDWQAQLRQIWEQTPIPPIQLTFYSAKLDTLCQVIVYPVCVYYAQRAPYLCAWGQLLDHTTVIDWRNYRLDRIHAIQPIAWNSPDLPQPLRQAYQQQKLPTPDDIQERMIDAWGFDFYQPSETLLLRFDPNFAKRYIANSLRHETFKPIGYAEAKILIRSTVKDKALRQEMLNLMKTRSPDDAYYTVQYRRHDLNILLRLRAWRPNMEVLLPWELRQQIADEVRQEYQVYRDLDTLSNSSNT